MNDAIYVLREQTHFDEIPTLGKSQDDFSKFLTVIEEWSPLLNNYNELVLSARNFDEKNETSIKNFYTKSATFAFEATIIYVAAFYGPSYNIVGTIYRSSGIQTVAFTCGPCVSIVLSNAHWFVRSALVETSSKVFEILIDCMQTTDLSSVNLENVTSCFINQVPFGNMSIESIVNDIGNFTNDIVTGFGNLTDFW